MTLLVATGSAVLALDFEEGKLRRGEGLGGHPTCLTIDPWNPERAWCGTARGGVFLSDDGGRSWRVAGLTGERITALAATSAVRDQIWAGMEPSALSRSEDGGETWKRLAALDTLPSSPTWSFPPRPDTHHVRWVALHPHVTGRAWVAIEAGALISTGDGGRSWSDRVLTGPFDTHELAIHPDRPEVLRVAAGDGYFESTDGGMTWTKPRAGLDIRYLRSVAIDPGDPAVVLVSGASGPRTTYMAGYSDGRLYRRTGGPWTRVTHGWPDPPAAVAPLLAAGGITGEVWAADERGVHRSRDGGTRWSQVATFETTPRNLRGLAAAARS